jgi:hypothetical protein
MYALEEYLLVVVVAIVLGTLGTAILALVIRLQDLDHLFDRALRTGSFALPPSWSRVWLAMRIAERWRALPMSFGRRAKLWWRRVYSRP